jgi:hypothetical protein
VVATAAGWRRGGPVGERGVAAARGLGVGAVAVGGVGAGQSRGCCGEGGGCVRVAATLAGRDGAEARPEVGVKVLRT